MDFMKRLSGGQAEAGIRLTPGQSVIPREQIWLLSRATQIVDDAHAEARRIAVAAQLAYEEARSEGYREGRDAARSEHALHMVEQVASSLNYLELVESRMIELVLAAVRRIVCEVPDQERVTSVVRGILSAARNQPQLTLRLCPTEADLVQPQLGAILAAYPGIRALQVQPDTQVAPGSGILESELGFVETSLESQIGALRGALKKVFGPGRPVPDTDTAPQRDADGPFAVGLQ